MLLGYYRHQVDKKGRVAVPALYRRSLPDGSVISYGTEGRLVIRALAEWEEWERSHRMSAQTAEEERHLLRNLFSSARVVELDAQGRMLLDAAHRRWAKIDDRAVFVGMGNLVEVVGEEVWDAEQASLDPVSFSALNDRVFARPGPASAGASTTPQ